MQAADRTDAVSFILAVSFERKNNKMASQLEDIERYMKCVLFSLAFTHELILVWRLEM